MVQRSQKQAHIEEDTGLEGRAEKHMATDSVQNTLSSPDRSPPPWSLAHGFYAGTGGFTFPSSSLRADSGRLTLTTRGVALLTECELLPDIEREDILDKSKSDGLSKFIACVQAAWMIVQVIGRLIMGLEVTQLEINTLGHVFCALIIYVLWWHKPRLVKEPTTLAGDWVGPLCAYMYMSSRISGGRNTANKGEDRKTNPAMSSVAFLPGRPCPQYCVRTSSCQNTLVGQSSADVPAWKHQDTASPPSEISRRPAPPGKDVGSFGHRSTLPHYDTTSSYEASRTDVLDEPQDLGTERKIRWCLAAEAVHNCRAIKRRFRTIEYTDASGQAATCLQEDQPEEAPNAMLN